MQCEEFEQRLNELLDDRRRGPLDAELRGHVDSCAACRTTALAYNLLLDGFASRPMPLPRADLAARVLADYQREPVLLRTVSVHRRVVFTSAALATAAGLLIGLLPLLRMAPRPEQQAENPSVVAKAVTDGSASLASQSNLREAPPSADASPVAEIVPVAEAPLIADIATVAEASPVAEAAPVVEAATGAEATPVSGTVAADMPKREPISQVAQTVALSKLKDGDPYVEVCKFTGRSLGSLLLIVPGIGGRRGIIDLDADRDGKDPTVASQVSDGLKPVTDSLAATLDLLFRTFPVPNDRRS